VAYVMVNPNVRPYPSHTAIGMLPAPMGTGVTWNIQHIQAPEVWAMGYKGQGIVVGGEDTGYDWTHPALKDRYRGWDSATATADHNYNWHDAWDHTAVPHDDDNHGTHTMGIVLGRDGEQNQIGVAPEAQWIGCRNMRRGIGNPGSYTECTEFLLAPYPLGGDAFHDGDVTRAADVVNNSWGCPDYEGCRPETLKAALDAMRAAGIMMVVSAGNDGPACQTVTDPPALYAASFSVGATARSGAITGFSSRGPVPNPAGGELLKPDIAAPGSGIRSSVPGGGYALADGTSMAGPHVAGLVALLWSARPHLRGDLQASEDIIRQAATPRQVTAACPATPPPPASDLISQLAAASNPPACACGGVTGIPNNVYGWGEIDALRAVQAALGRQ
jgi:serine protease AprX